MTHIVGQRSSIVTQSVDPRWPSYDESEVTITSCSKHHETTDEYPTVDEIAAGYLEQTLTSILWLSTSTLEINNLL